MWIIYIFEGDSDRIRVFVLLELGGGDQCSEAESSRHAELHQS